MSRQQLNRSSAHTFDGRSCPRRLTGFPYALTASLVIVGGAATAANDDANGRGGQFIGIEDFNAFTHTTTTNDNEVVLTSREFITRIPWNELILSWNADMPKASYLRVEIRAVYPECPTKFYIMGLWSDDPAAHPRESVKGQEDGDGDVDTDTLLLRRKAERFQLRLTLGGGEGGLPSIQFVGLHVLDSAVKPTPLPPNRAAWGKTLPVPARSQMAYEGGEVWCSPATVSMILGYWSERLKRPDLDHDVPEIVKGVFDRVWGGTGNWVFNTAYAGALPGLRAYVTRMSDVAELEDWVAQGVPVGLSLCYNRLRGKSRVPSGHLVVCVGFTKNGDAVINDPGTRQNVRKIFPRAHLIDAWQYSKNAAYIILPENGNPPSDRFGHWLSARSLLKAMPQK